MKPKIKTGLDWIEHTQIAQGFKSHLDDQSNNRILFSAPFGAGKSTFLSVFFESEENLEAYNTIALNPVNYSVAANQDIFELIKFDIIDHLLKKFGTDIIEKEDYKSLYILQSYIKNEVDFFRIATNLIKAIPGISGTADLIENIKEEGEKYFKYKDDINKSASDRFKEYLDSFALQQGSIYEHDAITDLIVQYVERLKSKTDKPLVMIIDDLDRLDPEHLFRILNIFSSHYHQDYTKNKFGIDKIIVVCDIKNVRQIFASRYGADVEFSGYIDKFYSTEIFQFDNRSLFSNFVFNLLPSINYTFPPGLSKIYVVNKDYNTVFAKVLNSIVNDLFEAKQIVLRSFTKISEFNVPQKTHQYPKPFNTASMEFFAIIFFLNKLFSTSDQLISAFIQLAANYDSEISMPQKGLHKQIKDVDELNLLHRVAMTPIVYFKRGFDQKRNQSQTFDFVFDNQQITMVYDLVIDYDNLTDWIDISHFRKDAEETFRPNPYRLLIKTIQECQIQGVLDI